MKKEEILQHLIEAKKAHIQWLEKAKLLVNGIKIKEYSIPIDATECEFGKWFYSDAQKLSALSNNPLECMQSIELLHFELHTIYLKIFHIYFNDEEKGFFSKIFSFKKKQITPTQQQQAMEHFYQMEKISHDLVAQIEKLHRRILAIPEEKLEKIM